MNKSLLIILTRNPELGKVKTRLAKSIGNQNALDIYKFLLDYTVKITNGLTVDKAVYYSERVIENDLWSSDIYQKKAQSGEDLGERIQNAFQNAFQSGYEKVVIIGSDMYDLKQNHLQEAFEKLDKHDVVIGPAEDGGYYLMGMNKLYLNAFRKKAWGTETVLKDTLNDLGELDIALMEMLNDIDVYEDIADNEAFQPFLKHLNV
ncbi:DUF2064 domain-containing protein [Flavobacteriaceae bacterium R38]|nr:DUF2064 domain-containing protein [Flavobacteriaceae bacterium R38]